MENLHKLIEKTVILSNGITYQIVWITKLNEKNIVYLINIYDFSDIIFCEITTDGILRVINDKNELLQLISKINGEITIFAY